MGDERVRVRHVDGETIVEVDGWPYEAATPVIWSCNLDHSSLEPGRWEEGTSGRVETRLQGGGREKGRVLFLYDNQSRPLTGQIVMEAVLTFSIPDRFRVLHVDKGLDVMQRIGDGHIDYLLNCLHVAAKKSGHPSHGGRLFWEAENDAEEQKAKHFGFEEAWRSRIRRGRGAGKVVLVRKP
ncbi:MAG TPA: hypothetical protein VGR77_06030 [Candidatus Dormibacteraeota bacterium]|nr:hypothetical protein [Candidatus Dormibacteraeota bacterium]